MLRSVTLSSRLLLALGMGMVGALSACQSPPRPLPTAVTHTEQFVATVVSVDMTTRDVVLSTPDGRQTTVVAGPNVTNLGRLNPGDRLTITINDAIAVQMATPGSPPVGTGASATATNGRSINAAARVTIVSAASRRNYRHLHRRERRYPHYRRARPCNAGLRPSPEGGRSGGRRLWRRDRCPPRSGRLANSGPAMTKAGSRQAAVLLCFHLDLAAFLPPGWRATRRAVGWGIARASRTAVFLQSMRKLVRGLRPGAKRLVELTQRPFASCRPARGCSNCSAVVRPKTQV